VNFGLHVRVGAGYDETIAYAQRLGCTSLQFFSGNPKTYRVGAIDAPALERFSNGRKAAGIATSAIHTSYLINLASEDPKISNGSLRLLTNDLRVAAAGSVPFVNTHLGSYGKRDRSEGFAQVVAALETALTDIAPGVCLDTAHSWAAGYEIDSAEGVDRFFDLVDREIGLDRVVMFHFNDTEIPLGGHKDRHWHIGEGLIGLAGFRAIAGHAGVKGKTAILETPGEEPDDVRNMDRIRSLFA
jgi:deoxyribonuclease-4